MRLVGEHKGNMAAAAKEAGKTPQAIRKLYKRAHKKLGINATRRLKKTRSLPHDRRGQADVADPLADDPSGEE